MRIKINNFMLQLDNGESWQLTTPLPNYNILGLDLSSTIKIPPYIVLQKDKLIFQDYLSSIELDDKIAILAPLPGYYVCILSPAWRTIIDTYFKQLGCMVGDSTRPFGLTLSAYSNQVYMFETKHNVLLDCNSSIALPFFKNIDDKYGSINSPVFPGQWGTTFNIGALRLKTRFLVAWIKESLGSDELPIVDSGRKVIIDRAIILYKQLLQIKEKLQ